MKFEDLFKKHNDMVYRICLRYTKSDLEARDLTQDAFLKIYQKMDTFKGQSSWLTWIYRVATNTCYDHLRIVNRRKDLLYHNVKEVVRENVRAQGDETLAKLTLNKIFKEVDELTKKILFFAYAEGLTHSEIADSLGVTRAAVSQRVKRFKDYIQKNEEKSAESHTGTD